MIYRCTKKQVQEKKKSKQMVHSIKNRVGIEENVL